MAEMSKGQFSEEDLVLCEYTKALSHPARLRILQMLAEQKECVCGRIVESLPLAQSTVSQHLKALRDAGLILGTADGPRSRYQINWDTVLTCESRLKDFFTRIGDGRLQP